MTGALSVLVSRVLVPLIWELEEAPVGAPLVIWADLLRVVPDEGAPLQRDLLALAHVSPRSMNVLASRAERLGLVTTEQAAKAGPLVRPTESGRKACRTWETRLAEVERRWQDEHATEPLASALRGLVGVTDVELPWLLLPYGPSDGSASIGPLVPRQGPPGGLPLLALLSQSLAAISLDYEAKHGWMLSMMATAFDGFPDVGVPIGDVAPFAGVKGNGKTLHERHGIVTVEPDPDQPKVKLVRLTEKGRQFRDRHRPTLEAVEHDWATQAGGDRLDAVRRGLVRVAAGLPSAHIRHLCMRYSKLGGFTEASPRACAEGGCGTISSKDYGMERTYRVELLVKVKDDHEAFDDPEWIADAAWGALTNLYYLDCTYGEPDLMSEEPESGG